MSDILIRVHRIELQYEPEVDGFGVLLADVPPGAQIAVHDPTVIQEGETAQATIVVVEPYFTPPAPEDTSAEKGAKKIIVKGGDN